jgi:hypothetical protein
MDYVRRAVVVEHEDNLHQPPRLARSPRDPFAVAGSHRVWPPGSLHNPFRLVLANPMPRGVFKVPLIPAESPRLHSPRPLGIGLSRIKYT